MKIQFSYSHEKNTSSSYNYFTLIKKKKKIHQNYFTLIENINISNDEMMTTTNIHKCERYST